MSPMAAMIIVWVVYIALCILAFSLSKSIKVKDTDKLMVRVGKNFLKAVLTLFAIFPVLLIVFMLLVRN